MKKYLLMLSLLAFIGCSSTKKVEPTQKSNLTVGVIKTKVIENVTTQSEILELFGAPNLIVSNASKEEVWNYSKASVDRSSSSSSGTAVGAGVSPVFLGFGAGKSSSAVSSTSTSSMDLIITFNKNGVVKNYKLISAAY